MKRIVLILVLLTQCLNSNALVRTKYKGKTYVFTFPYQNECQAEMYHFEHLKDGNYAIFDMFSRDGDLYMKDGEIRGRLILFSCKKNKIEEKMYVFDAGKAINWSASELRENTEVIEFKINKPLIAEYMFSNNLKHGDQFYYYENKLLSKATFLKGVLIETHYRYHLNGEVSEKTRFDSNSQLNSFTAYYENGNLKAEGLHKTLKPEGEWKYYYPNGDLKAIGKYVNTQEIDTWFYYNEKGDKFELKFIMLPPDPVHYQNYPHAKLESHSYNDPDIKGFFEIDKRATVYNFDLLDFYFTHDIIYPFKSKN